MIWAHHKIFVMEVVRMGGKDSSRHKAKWKTYCGSHFPRYHKFRHPDGRNLLKRRAGFQPVSSVTTSRRRNMKSRQGCLHHTLHPSIPFLYPNFLTQRLQEV